MADVRSLLRQQRAARRIDHPHASYTDTGKLACTICNDYIKTESLWDGHLRSAGHRQRLQSIHQASGKGASNGYAGFVNQGSDGQISTAPTNKRKLADSEEELAGEDETSRRKRTKPDFPPEAETPAKKDNSIKSDKPITPPFHRRTSGTPSAGVEMQIPSRPATPSAGGTAMATTPKALPKGRSPLIPDEVTASQQETIRGARPSQGATVTSTATAAAEPVDEDEWAAFEADLVHGSGTKPNKKPPAAVDSDAVITAPVMSAEEIAAKSEEEERAKRRALVDIQIEDEKEEATRALEDEFEVMEELEARARKLRERREALRAQSNGVPVPTVAAVNGDSKGTSPGKENAALDAEEEEDEEDDEDDWDGFRFRA
ncbi:hypothetical protein C7999DRAFT_13815 [Corynascus novoguineensis]|uniref:Coiled-coil domain-containing protein 16 n=1 Tax=Corynascus novoguineensis TaxID=1126955 RepID=A0AAN7CWL0_9PEZI|nr:hypothetical protein C7999DRAFT_13815 [Corynascus novoguineensis]